MTLTTDPACLFACDNLSGVLHPSTANTTIAMSKSFMRYEVELMGPIVNPSLDVDKSKGFDGRNKIGTLGGGGAHLFQRGASDEMAGVPRVR
jgi:hypothetical protein